MLSDAIVEPHTMMVKLVHAPVTSLTMFAVVVDQRVTLLALEAQVSEFVLVTSTSSGLVDCLVSGIAQG